MTEPAQLPHVDDPARRVRFGVFELDLQTGELRRDGVRIRLQDQPFQILRLLLERGGEVVTREELRARLWPEEFVDFDHGLNAAIRKLRTALDDSADNPRFVETLARRGYRFIAPVSTEPVRAAAVAPRSRRWEIAAAVVVVLVILATGATLVRRVTATSSQATALRSAQFAAVAVLPFTNDDPRNEHLSDGLTEILIDRLSRVSDLRVMARTSVFRFKSKSDPIAAAHELGVPAIVVGNVRRGPDGYTIHVELVDVRDGTQLWGHQYQARAADLPFVQGWISDDLVRELRRGIDPQHRRAVVASYTRNSEAYDLYLWGLHSWNRRGRDDLDQAVKYFKQAIELDPQFAEAYAGLSNAYGVMVGYGLMPVKEGVDRVMTAAQKALELDPSSAEAYTSIATTKFRNLWDFEGADRDYRRSLQLNPNYATGHQWYADYLYSMGRWSEARREIETAYRLDPFSVPINAATCWSFVNERRYRDAIELTHRARQRDARLTNAACVIRAYMLLGDDAGAIADVSTTIPAPAATALKAAYAARGRPGLIEMMRSWMIVNESNNPVAIAALNAMAGEKDQAFAWLEKAYEQRVSRLTSFPLDPAFDGLRSDPRYADLLRRIGLPQPPVSAGDGTVPQNPRSPGRQGSPRSSKSRMKTTSP